MKNLMSLKSRIHNKSRALNIPPQLILQNYMLGRLLVRIAGSEFRKNFVLKGGFLIGSLVGLESRTTMDIDGTIQAYPVREDTVRKMMEGILKIEVQDGIVFEVTRIQEIRKSDIYQGYRVTLRATIETMRTTLTVDLTSGDEIHPQAKETMLAQILDEEQIQIKTYPIETILAEKLQTILSRADQNTRPRDFYDVFILWNRFSDDVSIDGLKTAFNRTLEHRQTENILVNAVYIISMIENSERMVSQWEKYRAAYTYASALTFSDTLLVIKSIIQRIC